eukprot:952397-Pelagomonas_calceolata.AAC.1
MFLNLQPNSTIMLSRPKQETPTPNMLLDGLRTGGRDASLEGWPTPARSALVWLLLAVPPVGGTHC